MATKPKAGLRAQVSGFKLTFVTPQGTSLTTEGNLYPTVYTEDRDYEMCTPTHLGVKQRYEDSDGELWYENQLIRRKQVGEDEFGAPTYEYYDPKELKAAKASNLPNNQATVRAFKVDDVDSQILPYKTQPYIMVPTGYKGIASRQEFDEANKQVYDIIQAMVRDPKAVFLTQCQIRKNEGLYRLGIYQGYITLQRQNFPESLRRFPGFESGLNREQQREAVRKLRTRVDEFDSEAYVNEVRKRLEQVESGVDPEQYTYAEPVVPSVEDLLNAL